MNKKFTIQSTLRNGVVWEQEYKLSEKNEVIRYYADLFFKSGIIDFSIDGELFVDYFFDFEAN